MLRVLLLLATLLALCGCDSAERQHALRALPPAITALSVDYARNEVWGFGPGGNETGFNVIRLSDDAADRVAKGGVPWLNAQPGGRIHPDWAETPVPRSEFWLLRPGSDAGTSGTPTVAAVLDRYGFGFDLPPEHQTALDAALNAPASFFAFGPGGLVVVIVPASRTAYVFHAG